VAQADSVCVVKFPKHGTGGAALGNTTTVFITDSDEEISSSVQLQLKGEEIRASDGPDLVAIGIVFDHRGQACDVGSPGALDRHGTESLIKALRLVVSHPLLLPCGVIFH